MINNSKKNFQGKYFLKQLKKGDISYYKRLNDRFESIRKNTIRLSSISEQEMFISFLKLMDLSIEINKTGSQENVFFRK